MTEPAQEIGKTPAQAGSDEFAELPSTEGLPPDIECFEPIGRGGMGAVYRAKNRNTGELLAVKVLLPKHADDEKTVKRFLREATTLTALTHEHIVRVYGCGTTRDGIPYITMSFVPGMPLDVCLEVGGKVDADEAAEILSQCARALGYAHEHGVIHRDLKPGNIMIDLDKNKRPTVKILDFGISKFFQGEKGDLRLTDSGQILGTPLYMSPENVTGEELDGRSDIYTLGCVIFEALSGQPPFTAVEAYKVLAQHVQEDPPDLAELRPDLPPALVHIVKRMMEKKRADRYQSMSELLQDLKVLQSKGKLPPAIRLSGHQKHKLRALAGTVIVTLVTFALAYVALAWLRQSGIF